MSSFRARNYFSNPCGWEAFARIYFYMQRHALDHEVKETAAVLDLEQTAASNRYVRALRRLEEMLLTALGSGAGESEL